MSEWTELDSDRVADAAATWQRDGWVLIDALVSPERCATALAEIRAGDLAAPVAAGPIRRPDRHGDGEVRFRARQFDGTTLFPFPNAPVLNRLFVDPALVAFAGAALATDDLRLYQSRVWSKSGDHTNYEQPHHRDTNHSLLPTRNGPGFGHLELFVYLHDVAADHGAPRVATQGADGLGGAGTGRIVEPGEHPELYAGEVSAAGSAGSVLAYRSDVWHRGTDLPAGVERHILVVGFRPAAVEWIGFDEHAPLVNSPDWIAFAEASTPDELALFGIPRPGHPFWTDEVLEATSRQYPGLDLSPWRSALGKE